MATATLSATRQIARSMGLTPRTSGHRPTYVADSIKGLALSQAQSVSGIYPERWAQYFAVGSAAQLVHWAVTTGRIPDAQILDFREMTAWQVVRVIERVAASDLTGKGEADKMQAVAHAIRAVKGA